MSLFSLLALTASGCATVELSMPTMPFSGQDDRTADDERSRERIALSEALGQLEAQPWTSFAGDAGEDGFVNFVFGSGSPSPKDRASAYLTAIEPADDRTAAVRQDVARTLTATWAVAKTGRRATEAIEPIPADLRMIEDAIVEARECRLVFAEALRILARDTGSVEREEIRRVKAEFNEAILDLGRTADVIHTRLEDGPAQSFASSGAAF